MCKYQTGDVVWGLIPFSDGTGAKFRPNIILNSTEPPCKYLVVECSTLKDKHNSMKGIKIIEADKRFTECGFEEPTFITINKCWILERLLKPHPKLGANPIGKCNFVNEILALK